MSEDYEYIFEESKLVRESRKVAVRVHSGVSSQSSYAYTVEKNSGTDVWANTSGVVTILKTQKSQFPDIKGGVNTKYWRVSFDYDDIKGYENCKKVYIGSRTYYIWEKEEDWFGGKINHIDFIISEISNGLT